MSARIGCIRVVALLFAALAALSCGGSSPSAPSSSGVLSSDAKDLTEALLLGIGPLSDPANRGCVAFGTVVGWPSGTVIVVRVSAQLPQSSQGQIQQVVSRIGEATLGNVSATIQLANEND